LQRPPRRARLTRMQSLHYGTPQANSLHLIKHYFEQYPEDANKVVLSIKGAYHPKGRPQRQPGGYSRVCRGGRQGSATQHQAYRHL
jgi:hypothetical protein